jgi:hypothetical protein
MRIAGDDVQVKVAAPGAIARVQPAFGGASGCGVLRGEFFSRAAGTDIALLLQGLKDDLCQAPQR